MKSESNTRLKVGALVLLALAALALGTFLIGEESQLFRRKNDYSIRFDAVAGLSTGNPVQLNGVNVGRVKDVFLPVSADETQILVTIEVDRRYEERVRDDSIARIKTLGLLGDKFVEITSGSAAQAIIPAGGTIPTAPATNVDQLLASGEDVMDNVVSISSSLRAILLRMNEGQGLLGELTTDSETGHRMTDSVIETMEAVKRVAEKVDRGEGSLGRLINDHALINRLTGAITEVETVLTKVETGEGLLPGLLNDPATKERFDSTLTSFEATAQELSAFAADVRAGEGLLPKLLKDEEYGEKLMSELLGVVERIDRIATKLDEGDGSAAQILNDPAVFEAINDIVVGVNESKMLRWLIRNRQKKGIEVRYDELDEQDLLHQESMQESMEDSADPPRNDSPGDGSVPNDLPNR